MDTPDDELEKEIEAALREPTDPAAAGSSGGTSPVAEPPAGSPPAKSTGPLAAIPEPSLPGRKYRGPRSGGWFTILLAVLAGELLLLSALDFVPHWYGWAGYACIAIATVWAFVVTTPPVHASVPDFFGHRSGRVMGEGLTFRNPFESVSQLPLEKKSMEVTAQVTCKDGVTVTQVGRLHWRPAADLQQLFVFGYFEQSEEALRGGIETKISEVTANVAAVHDAADYREYRPELSLLINCALRLETAPHLGKEARETLKHYRDNTERIVRDLAEQSAQKYSPTERQYGIEIISYDLGDVKYDKETERAFAKKAQAEANVKAAEQLKQHLQRAIAALVKKGVSPDKAADIVQVQLGLANQTVISSSGGAVFPIVPTGGAPNPLASVPPKNKE